ncbi:CDP-glycerol glycerophosphotransferase family protein [Bacillus sp. CGMCC 1.16541]|uniref:CDP-glycerol glycerophosphotransferase family protein n=1 Tax=Bacillus sp. CGMCC 1.16541 TaxID=2185143 RepID=UPI000D737567|nr:CDP-glycerol glycerophosphotransferase family protein [Bacillus sp. CGMCC 1.16541]
MRSLLKRLLSFYLFRLLRKLTQGNYCYLLWIFPVKQNKIAISNYYGKGFGDNGKYISEELLKKGNNYDIVWLLKKDLINKVKFPRGIRVVEYGSFKALYELVTAKVWIDNCRKAFYPPKRKEQYYIQTWHGGVALKKVEKDVENKLDRLYVENAIKDSKMADVFISNSSLCTNMYRTAFWYDNKILEYGSPRCDILVNYDYKVEKKVRSYFKISDDVKLLIYAPTFRADGTTDAYDIDFNKLLKTLEEKWGGKWCVLVRLHPNVSMKSKLMEYTSNIINASDYDDMYELLAASNILITDYSSSMFEFSLTGKIVILYASDIKSYEKDRNFYFELNHLPYPVAENNYQLQSLLNNFDEGLYSLRLNSFLSKIGINEKGNASTKLVELIDNVVKGNTD